MGKKVVVYTINKTNEYRAYPVEYLKIYHCLHEPLKIHRVINDDDMAILSDAQVTETILPVKFFRKYSNGIYSEIYIAVEPELEELLTSELKQKYEREIYEKDLKINSLEMYCKNLENYKEHYESEFKAMSNLSLFGKIKFMLFGYDIKELKEVTK